MPMIKLDTFKNRMKESGGRFPLLTLDEFFAGNMQEDSIAPNQCGEGRPNLAEIWQVLQKAETMPNVAWVRVALHDDTEIEECNGKEILNLCGESILLCTTSSPGETEQMVNCQWLLSDGVIAVHASELHIYSSIPPIPEGYGCLEIVWD